MAVSADHAEMSLNIHTEESVTAVADAPPPRAHSTSSNAHQLVADFALPGVLAHDLDRVHIALVDELNAQVPMFSDALRVVSIPGKRLRPLLVLASGYAASGPAAGPANDRLIKAAVAVELLHLGSLVHDDVMDDASMRHGAPSINAKWDNMTAILVGDFLLGASIDVAATLGAPQVRVVASTLRQLCEGQANETSTLFSVDRDEGCYRHSIAGKTARLIAASCRLGAMEAGLCAETVELFDTFGHEIGMAFQIVDDLLDLTGTDDQLGKPAGHDIAQGVYTLPVIHTLRERPQLAGALGRVPDAPDLHDILCLVRAGSGIDATAAAATEHTYNACSAVESCAELSGPSVEMLRSLALCVLDRQR
jgi:heptaprenyl diphosphate synthase